MNRHGSRTLAAALLMGTLFAPNARAMIPKGNSNEGGSSLRVNAARLFGLGTAELLRYAAQVIWPERPALLDADAAARDNFREQHVARLESLRAMPRMELTQFTAAGNVHRLAEARLIVLDEDPLNLADIERIMIFIRDFARAGDAIVIESEGAHTLTLENLYLMRRLVLEQLRETGEHPDPGLTAHEQRAQRQRLVEQFAPRLIEIQGALAQHAIVADGVQLHTYAAFGDVGGAVGADRIRGQAAAQSVTVQEALGQHRRVFLIRNRAFSPLFFWRILQNDAGVQWILEARYQCTIESVDDVINCERFWLFQLLGSLHRSLHQVTVMELFPNHPQGDQ